MEFTKPGKRGILCPIKNGWNVFDPKDGFAEMIFDVL